MTRTIKQNFHRLVLVQDSRQFIGETMQCFGGEDYEKEKAEVYNRDSRGTF